MRIAYKITRANLCMEQGRELKEGSPARSKLMEQAIQDYEAVYKERPGDLLAGNNLAWLLVKEKGEIGRPLDLIEEVRKGQFSHKTISPERLPLEFLDTLGVVYLANNRTRNHLSCSRRRCGPGMLVSRASSCTWGLRNRPWG